MGTYSNGTGATKLLLQSTFEFAGVCGLVGIVEVDESGDTEEGSDKGANHDEAGARRGPGVLPGRKDAEHIVVLVDGLTKVSSLLGIPPLGVGITVLSLDARGVDVAAVLFQR